uniref:exodeoxyribonuclease III n=1 Tax=Micrurus spixii TaxID=129469 RepID=A0A2D4NF55_9SAUR
MMEEEIKLFSININGSNSQIKRKQILNKLTKQNVDIICLQEVHIQKQHRKYLDYPKLGVLFTALADQKKRGVAIYVKNKINEKKIYADEQGRILMIQINLHQKQLLLVGMYAADDNQKKFYNRLYDKIISVSEENICLIGDFNAIVDVKKDYVSTEQIRKKKKENSTKNFL